MKMKLLGGLLAATTITALGVAILPAIPIQAQVLGASNYNPVILQCGEYTTNQDWNISYEEILNSSQTNDGIKNTSDIINTVQQTGETRTTVWKYGSSKNIGSLTLTLNKDVDAIGLYATRWQGDDECSIYVNETELVLEQGGLLDYNNVQRFFVPLDSPTNVVNITGQQVGIRFYIYSIGFYSKNNFPNHQDSGGGGDTPVDPDPTGTQVEITINPNQGDPVDGGNKGAEWNITSEGFSINGIGTLTSDQARLFKGKTLTITGTNIIKIVFTCTANGTTKQGPGCFGSGAPSGYTYDTSGPTGTWQGSATNSLSFTAVDNQVRITSFVITYISNN